MIELYRRERISSGQAAELLGISLYGLRGRLDRFGVEFKYDVQEFKEDMCDVTGEALIRAMQAATCRDFDIEPRHAPMPVRDIAATAGEWYASETPEDQVSRAL